MNENNKNYHPWLIIDPEKEVKKITDKIKDLLKNKVKRQGAVVAMSGGIDSSVTAALSVEALGKDRVIGLLMPEKHSSSETIKLSSSLAEYLGIKTFHENITPILDAVGCYKRQAEAIREVIPEYDESYKSKIVLPSVLDTDKIRLFYVIAQSPDGKQIKARLNQNAYLGIVAATNFKQRTRKMLEYYYADKYNYAVMGTPNRLEYDQGFFVKLGDGAADIKPIAHLYKTQVYQIAEYLGIPEEIRKRPPTTDTYSMPQSQEEFYFSLPYYKMDICLFGKNNNKPMEEVAEAAEITVEQLKKVYNDIDQKRKTTSYLHLGPQLIEEI